MSTRFDKVSFINAICNVGLWMGIGSLLFTIISFIVWRLLSENELTTYVFAELTPWVFGGGWLTLMIGRTAYWRLPKELQD